MTITNGNLTPILLSQKDRIAAFGPDIPTEGLLGTLIPILNLTTPPSPHGCTPLTTLPPNTTHPWLALVQRGGGCSFAQKVREMQRHNAAGIVVGDNIDEIGLITMYAAEDTSDIVIPAVFVSKANYESLVREAVEFGVGDVGRGDGDGLEKMVTVQAKARGILKRRKAEGMVRTREDEGQVRVVGLPVILLPNDLETPLLEVILVTVVSPAAIMLCLYLIWYVFMGGVNGDTERLGWTMIRKWFRFENE